MPLNLQRYSAAVLSIVVLICNFGLPVSKSIAEEPYQRFISRLREERLYDLALLYLERLESQPGVSKQFLSELSLERGILLYQSAALLSPQAPLRVEKIDSAEAAIREFLDKRKQHPRRGEARLKLGELLLTRAEEAKLLSKAAEGEAIPEAVKFYDEAHELFESTITELADQYQNIKGNRTDASDTSQVAYRQQLQQDLRQAQLLSAKAVEDRGRARAADSKEQKADLEKALTMFSDLYTKEQRMVGIRNYALFYRSKIQATLGKQDDAIDGFQRIADLDGVDVLRPLQSDSITELVKLLSQAEKYPVAVDRADKWLGGMRPNEQRSPEALNLRLALSNAKVAWANSLEKKNAGDRVASRLLRDTRSELRSMLRIVGPHLDATRDLLAELGVESETAENQSKELPQVKNFSEALAEAQQRIDAAEAESLGLAVIRERLADANLADSERQTQLEQLDATQEVVSTNQQQALTLLRQSLRLFSKDDDRSRLFDARFRIAYLLLKQQRLWDAIVVGEFLSRSNPGTEDGLRAAVVTLSAFSDLLKSTGEDKSMLTAQLEPFAQFLVETWPDSTEASAASSALVSLAVGEQDWDKAERFLNLVPGTGGKTAKLRRDLGVAFYAKYLEAQKSGDGSLAKDMKTRAIKWLELGIQEATSEQFDPPLIDAANSLARLLLSEDKGDRAAKLLFDQKTGLADTVKKLGDEVPVRSAMETYRTAIQVTAAQLVADQLPPAKAVEQMQKYVGNLQTLGEASIDGQKLLTGIFLGLARDLEDKLNATQQPARRDQLAEVVLLVVNEAAKSDSFSTQYWAADTMLSISNELANNRAGKAAAEKGYQEAAALLNKILDRDAREKDWINPESAKTQIQLLLALAQRGVGNYQEAVLSLGKILDEKNGLLDIQIEAAKTLQAWGSEKSGFHRLAILGGRKSAETGQNVIWGWGKISQVTANRDEFAEQFFEARYQLARSRFLYAQGLEDAAQKETETIKAEKDISSTATLYPQLGGPTKKQEYNNLLKTIQKALGKPTNGLAAYDAEE